MIYLDTSVALAHAFDEPAQPSSSFWDDTFYASRLLQYEMWNRLHLRGASGYRHERALVIMRRLRFLDMTPEILARALQPFPVPVRTLDGLHLATMDHLRAVGIPTTLASYDARLVAAADAMGFETVQP